MNGEFKQRPLKTMSTALHEAGRLLSEISHERGRCLDVVVKCQPLVTWLKETIKGICLSTNVGCKIFLALNSC